MLLYKHILLFKMLMCGMDDVNLYDKDLLFYKLKCAMNYINLSYKLTIVWNWELEDNCANIYDNFLHSFLKFI